MFLGMPAPWTPELVADRLVAAFRRVPSCPVLSSARGFSMGDREVEPFGWPERYIKDRRDRTILMTWARCRASGQAVAPLYRELVGNAERAEYRRRVALAAIVRGLNSTEPANGDLTFTEAAFEPST